MHMAVSIQSTNLLSFNPHRVHAHPNVIRFYEAMETQGGGGKCSIVTHSAVAAGGLTAEQRAKIESNRAAALLRKHGGGLAKTIIDS
ncbi:MAG: hypothetical protein SGPRY_007407 [Prymnesium sp.]